MAGSPAPSIALGTSAADFVRRLPEFAPSIELFTLVVYKPSASLAERLEGRSSPAVSEVLKMAKRIRLQTDNVLPYWEAVLAAAWASQGITDFASDALYHSDDATHDRCLRITRDDLRETGLDEHVASLRNDDVLALDSRCTLRDGSTAHLPLMDFRMLPRPTDAKQVAVAVRALGQDRGAILESGRSYHYYGFDPMTTAEWLHFCTRSLLLSPLTDSRYIAHRMLAGAAALRITASTRKPLVPWVAEVL